MLRIRVLQSLSPIASAGARVLVLGTMPGVRSLAAGRYYEHPRNAFWKIASHVLGIDPTQDYAERCTALCAAGLALWDVLKHCEREGSLDSDIVAPVPNDFRTFFAEHPTITRVYFNGAAAEKLYTRHVTDPGRALEYARLPSTSPAQTMAFAAKLAKWKAITP